MTVCGPGPLPYNFNGTGMHRFGGQPLAICKGCVNLTCMALAQNRPRISEAEYLQIERQAETKCEFFNGEMFAMAGGTARLDFEGSGWPRL
jgi:hypothetical protein